MKRQENNSTFLVLTAVLVSLVLGMLTTTAQAALVGYWNFNETSGNALDSSGNGFTGTLTGPASRIAGPSGFGNAMSFGYHGYVDITNSATSSLNLLDTNYTITFWVKSNSSPSDVGALVSKNSGTDGYAVRYFQTAEAGYDYGKISTRANTENWYVTTPVGQNEWDYFSVVVYKAGVLAERAVQELYKNGVLVNAFYSNTLLESADNLTFGNGLQQQGAGWTFDGSLDEIRIYDEALSVTAIQSLMTPVPEPAATTLLVLGAITLLCHRKKK
jgi:hypothetical protein